MFFVRNRSFLVENSIERMKKVRLKNELKRMKKSHSLIHVATSNLDRNFSIFKFPLLSITACLFDIRLYLTPLGQARQFIVTCGT